MKKNIIYGLIVLGDDKHLRCPKNPFLWIFMILMMVASVSGATLHGDIYDLDLEKVENVLVEITSNGGSD